MNLIESLKLAIASLKMNKMRTFLTLLGIVIGVMAIILLVSVITGSRSKIEDEMQAMGTNMLTVIPGNSEAQMGPPGSYTTNRLKMRHVELINDKSAFGADSCPEYDIMGVNVKYKNESRNVSFVSGMGSNFERVFTWKVDKGAFYREEDVKSARKVAIIGVTVVKNIFKGVNPVGKYISVRGIKFRVIGVMEEKGSFFGMDMDDAIYMPITTAQNIGGSDDVHQITVRIPDPKQIDMAKADIKRLLLTMLDKTDFSVMTQGESLDMLKDIMSVMELITYVIAMISLLVGGIGIMNIMLVTVTERTREIGIRKAVGASAGNILTQFIVESVIVSVIGGLIGIIVSVTILAILSPLIPFPVKASGVLIIVSFAFSSLIGIFFGTYPAVKASKIDPIAAMRYE